MFIGNVGLCNAGAAMPLSSFPLSSTVIVVLSRRHTPLPTLHKFATQCHILYAPLCQALNSSVFVSSLHFRQPIVFSANRGLGCIGHGWNMSLVATWIPQGSRALSIRCIILGMFILILRLFFLVYFFQMCPLHCIVCSIIQQEHSPVPT